MIATGSAVHQRDFKSLAFTNFATPAEREIPINTAVTAPIPAFSSCGAFGNRWNTGEPSGMSSPEIIPKPVPQTFPARQLIKSPLAHPEITEVIPTLHASFWSQRDYRLRGESE